MSHRRRDHDLGLDRNITRRDFINGVAVGLASASLLRARPASSSQARAASDYYPPALTGLRGSHPGSFEVAHDVRDGAYESFPAIEVDTAEAYDLVVVGGGLSGLAAAYFFRKVYGDDKRVLILDNHDDFGGHAKRNEFTHEGRMFIGYGGTMGIETPFPYSYVARSLVEDLGVRVDRYPHYVEEHVYEGLERAMFFDRETFGADRLVPGIPRWWSGDGPAWRKFLDGTPLSETCRRDLLRLFEARGNEKVMAGLGPSEKKERLARMSYQDFLVNELGVTPEAMPFLRHLTFRNHKKVDTCPALEAAESGAPGFASLGLEGAPRLEWGDYHFHYPDGNASLARLLVAKLVPRALPDDVTMESIVVAPLDYARLDEADAPVRIRLSSTVVRVQHEGPAPDADWVRLAYVVTDRVHGIRARNVVLACYHQMIPFLVPELPDEQKRALADAAKVPLLYTNVFIREWTAFDRLKVRRVYAPGMYHEGVNLDEPVSIGGYRCTQSPEEPVILHLVRSPTTPGILPRREQLKAGMHEMLTTSFETIERSIRDQLGRMLGGGGFDPATDILGITVNRWPHGYAYTPDTLSDPVLPEAEQFFVVGRQPFGRIAIANSDAGGAAFTNTAFDQAHRAVLDLTRTREPY